jgi:pimeloyl-ACP methyl ester carboxylesterase
MRLPSFSRSMAGMLATRKFRTEMRCGSELINRGGLRGGDMKLQRAAGMAASSCQLISWAVLLVLTPNLLTMYASGDGPTQGAPSNASVQEGVVKLADSNIEYFSQGQGESIVLLPFGGLTVGYMQELSNDLADAGYRVVRINFRGSGKSSGPGEGITLHTLAADVAGVIRPLKLGRVNIAGHAFGNRVARTLAADHPELVRSVILFAAGGKVPPDPPGERALQAIFNPASTDADILSQMKYMVGNAAKIPMAWQAIKPCRAPQVAGIQRTAMQNTPLKDWWAPPGKTKYLILQGTNDQIAPPENAVLLKQELGERATLVSFPGAGHLFIVTEPKKAAAAVVSFLHQATT